MTDLTRFAFGRWQRSKWLRFSPLLLLLTLTSGAGSYLPSHTLEVKFALAVSGCAKPFTRHQLLKYAPPATAPRPLP